MLADVKVGKGCFLFKVSFKTTNPLLEKNTNNWALKCADQRLVDQGRETAFRLAMTFSSVDLEKRESADKPVRVDSLPRSSSYGYAHSALMWIIDRSLLFYLLYSNGDLMQLLHNRDWKQNAQKFVWNLDCCRNADWNGRCCCFCWCLTASRKECFARNSYWIHCRTKKLFSTWPWGSFCCFWCRWFFLCCCFFRNIL